MIGGSDPFDLFGLLVLFVIFDLFDLFDLPFLFQLKLNLNYSATYCFLHAAIREFGIILVRT